ncbi:MAG: terminase [Acidobacteria bacterium]|nr:terminase [Acidobacteriota bacterium]
MKESEWALLGRRLDLRPDCLAGVRLAETLLRIRNKSGAIVPLVANRAQRAFECRAGRANVVLKARQMGMTTWIAGRFLLKTILIPGTTSVLVAHTREAAEQMFTVVRRMWEHLPEDLREGAGRTARLNAGAMVFGEIDSEFRVVSAAEMNAGRGVTIRNLHCSEVSRWPGDAMETLAGLKAALVPGGELVMESTANGAFGCFYREWMQAEEKGVVRHFFPWWMEESYRARAVQRSSLREDEQRLVEREGLQLDQIGFRRELERTYGTMRVQEFAEDAVSCFRASGDCVFDVAGLVACEPLETRWNGALHIWLPPVTGRTYGMGVDPAGGGSEGDFAAVQVVDQLTGMQCAELRARLHPRVLSGHVTELAREYNDAMVAVERNNHGAAVLAYLDGRNLRMYVEHGQMGMLTTNFSRAEMIAWMGVLLTERPALFRSARLMEECRSFVLTKSGRAEAASGTHDDLVMAMGVAQRQRVVSC